MFRAHVYVIVIHFLMVESFSFYKIFHDFLVYVLSLKFPVRGICQVLKFWFPLVSDFGTTVSPGLLQTTLSCKSHPSPLASILFWVLPIKRDHLGHPWEARAWGTCSSVPFTHSGKLLAFIYLVCSAGSWSSRAVCCPLFSAGPWHLDIPWSIHSPGQEPAIWAVLQSATCWVYAGVPLHQEKTEQGHSACCSTGDGRMDRGLWLPGFSCWRWQYCCGPCSKFFLILFYFTFKSKLKLFPYSILCSFPPSPPRSPISPHFQLHAFFLSLLRK